MLFTLFLVGAVFTRPTLAEKCVKRTLPKSGSCEYDIKWKTYDDNQALATCLDHFPTTFVTAKRTADTVTCTVKAAYQCVKGQGEFLMYDKCYSFHKDPNYVETNMADAKTKCKNGKLAIFYSYTQAKFVGMKAHELEIGKIWIGIDSEGREIQGDHGKNKLIHSNLWKLIKGDYWNGDELKKCADPKICSEAKNIFMRTRTDHVNNRFQGSFELANDQATAYVACEYDAKYLSDQKWYCDKLSILNLDSVYDDNKRRCLYVSANKYPLKVKNDNRIVKIQNACQERPSQLLHSSGLDDGTAKKELYAQLKTKNTLRLSAYLNKDEGEIIDNLYKPFVQRKCATDKNTKQRIKLTDDQKGTVIQKWRHVDHHGKEQHYIESAISWHEDYPKNECSDFPSESTTLGVKGGKLVDLPPDVRFKALCSITFFQQCQNTEKTEKPCDYNDLICNNQETYANVYNKIPSAAAAHPLKEGFYTCDCPEKHTFNFVKKECEWKGGDENCGYAEFHYQSDPQYQSGKATAFAFVPIIGRQEHRGVKKTDFWKDFGGVCIHRADRQKDGNHCNDALSQMVVRKGCKMTIYAHHWNNDYVKVVKEIGYGTHQIPTEIDGTLGGQWDGVAASSMICSCP